MKTIEQTYTIKAPVDRVWQAFVDPKQIERWSGDTAIMTEQVHEDFSLWSGDVHGTNTQIVPQMVLTQDWYGGDWPEPSKVTFTFQAIGDTTIVRVIHVHVPDDEAADIEDGWIRYYMGPLQKLVEA